MSIRGVAQFFEEEQQIAKDNQQMLEKILDKITILETRTKINHENLIGYYTIQEIVKITQKSVTTIYREIKKDEFPKQVRLGQKSSGWCKKEIIAWISINTNKGCEYISQKGWSNIYTERYALKN